MNTASQSRLRLFLLSGSVWTLAMAQAFGAELVVVDGPKVVGKLVACSDSGIEFHCPESEAAQQSVGWDEVVRWSHPRLLPAQPLVVLADGSLLVVEEEWTKQGGTIRLQKESLSVATKLLGEIDVPRSRVAAVVLSPHSLNPHREPFFWQRQLDQFRNNTEESDHVHLQNGDLLTGEVTVIDGEQLEIETETGSVAIVVSDVQAIAFRPPLLRAATEKIPCIVLGLTDGSLIYAKDVRADEGQLELKSLGKVRMIGRNVGDIASLQTFRSTRFDYLSDLEPTEYRHIPYLDLSWHLAMDRNVRRGPLFSGGQQILKGLGMHSASRVVYPLDGAHDRFDAEIALDDSSGLRGSVVFRVFLAKDDQWKEAFTSAVVRGNDPPRPVSVDLAGAQAMTLIVDYADRGDELDHANWLNARLLRRAE